MVKIFLDEILMFDGIPGYVVFVFYYNVVTLPKIEQSNCPHYESMKASPDFTWSVVLHIFWESQATSP